MMAAFEPEEEEEEEEGSSGGWDSLRGLCRRMVGVGWVKGALLVEKPSLSRSLCVCGLGVGERGGVRDGTKKGYAP